MTSPDMHRYPEQIPPDPLEAYLAGVISTFPPHDTEHPEKCIPIASAVLVALGQWEQDTTRNPLCIAGIPGCDCAKDLRVKWNDTLDDDCPKCGHPAGWHEDDCKVWTRDPE